MSLSGVRRNFVSVAGKAQLNTDRKLMEAHWVKQLDQWLEKGIDTLGMVMIEVKAHRIKYWQGMDEGEMKL